MLKLMFWAIFTSVCLAEGSNSSFNFNSTQKGFAKFKTIILPPLGIAQLQFCFKTASPSFILLYQGDGIDKYIFLELNKGKIGLKVRGHTDCKAVKTEEAEQTLWNDSRWHNVRLEIDTRKSTRISLKMDGFLAATVERNRDQPDKLCTGLKLARMHLKTNKELYLYLAGSEVLDKPVAFAPLRYLAVDKSYKFTGCIANVEYNSSDALKLQRAEVVKIIGSTGHCTNACGNEMKTCDQGEQCSMGPHANPTDNATITNSTKYTEPSTESPHSTPDSPANKWDRDRAYSVAPASNAPFFLRADMVVTFLHVFTATWLPISRCSSRIY